MQLQGRFGGIAFFTSQASTHHDRAVAAHKFPYRNQPYIDDLGAQPIKHQLDLYVLGDDHVDQRNRLLAAFRAGVGELVHPYYGSMQAVAQQVRVVDSNTHQRQSKLQATFVVVHDATPQPHIDTQARAATAANVASNTAQSAFVSAFKPPQTALEATQTHNDIQALLTDIKQLNGKVGAFIAPIDQFAQDVANIGNEAATLIRTPSALASSLMGVALSALGAINDIGAAFATLDSVSMSNSTNMTSANAQPLTQLHSTALAIGYANQLSSNISNNPTAITSTDVQAHLASVMRRITTAQQQADDATYQALAQLTATVHAHVQASLPTLAQLRLVDQAIPMPMLVLNYHHTGTIDNADTNSARNNISHPLFASGHLELAVLQ